MIKSLTIILPFYNEEQRINKTFKEIIKFSRKNKIKFKEFIFVDDGSFDKSNQLVKNFIYKKKLKLTKLRLIKLAKNSGKGAAIQKGVKVSNGEWILTSDIDFSVSLFELEKWEKKKYLQDRYPVYFGSRSHSNSNVDSKFYRKIIGNLLRFLISYILGINIRDTQCGFKLYKKNIAKKLFSRLIFLGYEHDIEIVILLKRKKISIIELPVTWKHVPQSKVNLVYDSCKIFLKIFFMKLKY
jgi:dolichyl-phosphate beta-glucosyltransferase